MHSGRVRRARCSARPARRTGPVRCVRREAARADVAADRLASFACERRYARMRRESARCPGEMRRIPSIRCVTATRCASGGAPMKARFAAIDRAAGRCGAGGRACDAHDASGMPTVARAQRQGRAMRMWRGAGRTAASRIIARMRAGAPGERLGRAAHAYPRASRNATRDTRHAAAHGLVARHADCPPASAGGAPHIARATRKLHRSVTRTASAC
ncbi:conserved hypothetical protein [Burkholderia pseudomallei 1106b]|uniref:Uncharacterized protein n=1 Tax=Burkholderia pseudomallei (strain 1106a) TaxID=357348 RepID=A3P6R8_BURP0|nr:conserved hypothetical protein [Burkholderia pseudomallei 1106a]EES21921.1 conserved hypothetical protein [Burkholderia pseudomallei 1106b]